MPLSEDPKAAALRKDVLQAFDAENGGVHPGFRPAHAKGVFLAGTFTPSSEGRSLSKAPHIQRDSTPVIARLSDFAGIPNVADNNPEAASPRGLAIRFQLAEHVHTDIVSHSVETFPARTVPEFLEFLRAIVASGPGASQPSPVELYLGSHPAALAFVQIPKPIPVSFANESFFAVSAFKFTNSEGKEQFGRYRILPEAGSAYLPNTEAAAKGPDFLFEELRSRLQNGSVRYRITVRLAGPGDVVDDATVIWPADRPEIELGTIALTNEIPASDPDARRIIFDPIPRVEGIDASADPLFEPRADIYLASGRRRRDAIAAATA